MSKHGAVLAGITVAAVVGVWRVGHLSDRMTDRLFRQPSGPVANRFYRDTKPHQDAFRETLAALSLDAHDQLLEIGSGGGTFLAWALGTGCTARAIDHSTEMLALASRRNSSAIAAGRLELREADAASLPFPDGEFTAAAAINCFFFFDAPKPCLPRSTGPSHRQGGLQSIPWPSRRVPSRPHAPLHRQRPGAHVRRCRLRADRAAAHRSWRAGAVGHGSETRRRSSLSSSARRFTPSTVRCMLAWTSSMRRRNTRASLPGLFVIAIVVPDGPGPIA